MIYTTILLTNDKGRKPAVFTEILPQVDVVARNVSG